jgi:feruloyl esterase
VENFLVIRWVIVALAAFGLFTMAPANATTNAMTGVPAVAPAPSNGNSFCTAANLQAIATSLSSTKVMVKPIPDGMFPGAFQSVAATPATPEFCQASGSFVTNPKTGRTANFLATFPANWNGKYLQIGCSGHCGQFYVSDPALPSVNVTTQGYANEILSKGYAAFATDEGHLGMDGGAWAIKGPGKVDQDAINDYYYRADEVLATMGKEFTRAYYQRVTGKPVKIAYSYFCGCSGGGRDAFIAAAYFPEQFDGIIAGSAYNLWGTAYSAAGSTLAAARPGADVSPELIAMIDPIVTQQCNKLDGVRDGIIQNPGLCDFRPARDLPRCPGDRPGPKCFTAAQIQTVSTIINGVTDVHGNIVQPGFSVSNFYPIFFIQRSGGGKILAPGVAPSMPLWDAALKIFIDKNNPAFSDASIFSFKTGGPGQVTGFHTVVSQDELDKVAAEGTMGDAHNPALFAKMIAEKRKMLIWHNFGDGNLSPYMSINFYKALAKLHGGYGNLQNNVRLFMLPGSTHCSITSVGPNSFDALTAMENWVEKGQAPDALLATVVDRQFTPGAPKAVALQHPGWTAKLCKFPEEARYAGHGDVMNARNWSCPANDTRLLQIGESGRQAGEL